MNRRALFGIGGTALLPLSALAQDGSIPEEWEERFVALEERVAAIEERLDALDGEDVPGAEETSEEQAQPPTGDVIRFTGSGTTLTDVVSMNAGLYRVTAIVYVTNGVGDFFNLEVAGSNDWDDEIFFEFFDENSDHGVSTNWTAKRDGEYAFQVDCMSDWDLTFEAM